MRPIRSLAPLRSLPGGLLGMLVLVGAVEWTLARHDLALLDTFALNGRFVSEQARGEALRSQVLCFGDSQVKVGVSPRQLERVLNVRACNLSALGMPPMVSYFVLRRVLERGARPAAIVVGHMSFWGDSRPAAPAIVDLLEMRDCLELGWAQRDASYAASLVVARALPSVRLRHRLRTAVHAQLAGQGALIGLEKLAVWDRLHAERGAHLIAPDPSYHGGLERGQPEQVFLQPWATNSVCCHYFERLLTLAEAHRIPVCWLVAPLVPEAQRLRDAHGLDADFTLKLHAMWQRHPGVTVVDARHAGYPASLFIDTVHLNERGAGLLSTQLAAILKDDPWRRPPQARWITLPPCGPFESAIVAENDRLKAAGALAR